MDIRAAGSILPALASATAACQTRFCSPANSGYSHSTLSFESGSIHNISARPMVCIMVVT